MNPSPRPTCATWVVGTALVPAFLLVQPPGSHVSIGGVRVAAVLVRRQKEPGLAAGARPSLDCVWLGDYLGESAVFGISWLLEALSDISGEDSNIGNENLAGLQFSVQFVSLRGILVSV